MKRKIIGILIILIGLVIMGSMVYVMFFMENFSLDSIFLKIRGLINKEEIVEPVVNTNKNDNVNNNSNNIINNNSQSVNSIKINPNKTVVTIEDDKVENKVDVKEEKNTPSVVNKDAVKKIDIARMASLFAERFGSFSNQSNYKNITDLKPYMTVSMKKWADSYVNDNRKKEASSIYYGITTKSVSYEFKKFDNDLGLAEVFVNTRRMESLASTANTSSAFNQDLKIVLKRENKAWKIDGAFWQDK